MDNATPTIALALPPRLLERLVLAHERLADAATRAALTLPDLQTEDARWMFAAVGQVVAGARAPAQPESVSDPRTRTAILALGLGERLALWALPEDQRRARIAAERAEREAAAQANGAGQAPDGTPF